MSDSGEDHIKRKRTHLVFSLLLATSAHQTFIRILFKKKTRMRGRVQAWLREREREREKRTQEDSNS